MDSCSHVKAMFVQTYLTLQGFEGDSVWTQSGNCFTFVFCPKSQMSVLACEVTQQKKVFAGKLDHLSSVPGTHMVEGTT